ncbi:MAG: hypothetical protein ABII71_00405 [Candidatus Micrarchaeota archaeon]
MKGQYFSFDAIVASVIFVLALMALLSYWHGVRSYLDFQNSDVQSNAIRISNLLFTPSEYTSLTPDCGTIERIGFATSWNDRIVDWEMLDLARRCSESDSGWLREKLASPYNVTLTVTYPEPPPWSPDSVQIGSVDFAPDEQPTEIVLMRRLATVQTAGGTYLATLDLRLYR